MATDDRSYPSRGYSGLRQDVRRYNAALDARLQHRWGISVKLWKVLRATTDLVAVMLAGYAMWLGADPGVALLVIAAVVVGVEAVEVIVAQGEESSTG
ncbi:hypothetical protein [Halorubrum tebenquichense]|uniref:Uncharacterized protein n=1 Tax=Halorubrum tebenquichense DSM 14210 TaxID=1227485 RepID=M0DKW8_9EURY|nr:hypothetical protein [Halorubrum tebenquichense]ELZ35362.1 hypothetical protein C472_12530 [Halorubrum tebenquichense DSM 14210]